MKESGQLRRWAKSLIKYCEEGDFIESKNIEEEERVYWGIPKIVDKLWLNYDLGAILQRCLAKRSVKFDFCQAVKLMLADRFHCPCSKLKSYEGQDKYAFYENVEQHQLYRSLDYLADFKDNIDKMLFQKNIELFNRKVDVVFFDVTTLYFEDGTEGTILELDLKKEADIWCVPQYSLGTKKAGKLFQGLLVLPNWKARLQESGSWGFMGQLRFSHSGRQQKRRVHEI